jgi:hypothetical protein
MLGNFNVSNYDWINSVPFPYSYHYNKIKGNSVHTATCFLVLDQRNNSIISSTLLDLVFSDITDISPSISSSPVVTSVKYHPPLLLGFNLTLGCHLVSLTPRRSHDVLRHSGWSFVLNENSVHSAVHNLTATVREAINVMIPYIKYKNSTFPHWFCNS